MIERHYKFLKELALVWMPGVATLYFTFSQIWGIPFGAEVVGSITAIDTFLGVILHISANKTEANGPSLPDADGVLFIDPENPGLYRLDVKKALDGVPDSGHVVLKVAPEDLGTSQGKHAL